MKGNVVMAVTIALVLVVLAELLFSYLRKRYEGRMVDLLENRDYGGFDAYCEQPLVRLAIPPYSAKVMKLNVAFQDKDQARIDRTFGEIGTLKLTSQEKCDIALRGFYHYLPLGEKDKCRKCVKAVQETSQDEAMKQTVLRFYDVLIERRDALLPTLLSELEGMEELERYTDEYLISEIYRNRGEEQQAQRYAELSKQHKQAYLKAMNDLDFRKKRTPH